MRGAPPSLSPKYRFSVFCCGCSVLRPQLAPDRASPCDSTVCRLAARALHAAVLRADGPCGRQAIKKEFGELLNFKARQGEAENHFVSEYQYDSLGFELERMLPGGISQSFAYDNIGRLVDSKTSQFTKVRRVRRYHWGKIEQSGEWRFKYDKDGQLTEKYKGSGKW